MNGGPLREALEEHRDRSISVVGGIMLFAACAWWAVKAAQSDAPVDAPDFYGLASGLYFCLGAVTLGPGLLSFGVLRSKPRLARHLATFGRITVVAVACLYVIGRLALMQLDARGF